MYVFTHIHVCIIMFCKHFVIKLFFTSSKDQVSGFVKPITCWLLLSYTRSALIFISSCNRQTYFFSGGKVSAIFSAPLTRLFWIYISKKYFDNLYFTCMLWTLKVSPEMLQPENLNEAEWSWYNHGEWPGLEA